MIDFSMKFLADLVRDLTKHTSETEWVEFKENKADPSEIGETISALSNAAALVGRELAYMVWGVRDGDHTIVGTAFDPCRAKKGNEELESWLSHKLWPRIPFHFRGVDVDGRHVVVLIIGRAQGQPTQFDGVEYVRVGSCRKKLKDFPTKESELWRGFDKTPFEKGIAHEHVTVEGVLTLLDFRTYFELQGMRTPEHLGGIVSALQADRLIAANDAGGWDITNLGAIMFAIRLSDFEALERKAIRVVVYDGRDRMKAKCEQVGV